MEGSIRTEEVKKPSSEPGGTSDEPSFLTAVCIFTLRLPTPGSISSSNRSNPPQIVLILTRDDTNRHEPVCQVSSGFPVTNVLSGSYN